MGQLTKTNYKSAYGSAGATFPDNTTGLISEADMRQFGEDNADTFMSISDNFIDEDSFASDSATKVPSQQSTKAYIDSVLATASLRQTSVINISSAELLSLNGTPKELVAAPGANKIIALHRIIIKYTYSTAAYATNTTLETIYAGTSASPASAAGVIGQSVDVVSIGAISTVTSTSDLTNKALQLRVSTGNPTAGSGTLKVIVDYSIADFT